MKTKIDETLKRKYIVEQLKDSDNKSGCRFLTVNAYSDAIPFYEKNGFVPLNDADVHDETRLLYFDLNDVS